MKLRYIFLTIALIVVAHLVVLYICFHQPEGEKSAKAPEKLHHTQPSPVSTPSGSISSGTAVPAAASVPAVRPSAAAAPAMPAVSRHRAFPA